MKNSNKQRELKSTGRFENQLVLVVTAVHDDTDNFIKEAINNSN